MTDPIEAGDPPAPDADPMPPDVPMEGADPAEGVEPEAGAEPGEGAAPPEPPASRGETGSRGGEWSSTEREVLNLPVSATSPAPSPAPAALPAMPLMEHLRELRTRLIYSVAALLAGMILSLAFAEPVMFGLMRICGSGCCFQAIEPLEKLTTWFRIALILGLVFATPVILYQIVAFVMPALHRHERRYFLLLLPGAGLLFALGMLFGYTMVLPRTIGFLVGFLGGTTDLSQIGSGQPDEDGIFLTCLRISTYVSFLTNLLLVVGLAFETPLVVFLLSKIGLLTPATMKRYRRHAILIIAVLAAILTPTPDPFTMFMVAVPMYIMYELGGVLARVF